MNISRSRFPLELVKIIQLIADSHFIAFDLEFSGISGRRNGREKPSLQEVYEDVKEAAERYQVLQVGLTVVHEDLNTGSYIARPYNFNINPIPASEKLPFERVWSFQSGAVDFLLRNNFNFDLPYTHGIPYLSRKDEDDIRAAWIARDEHKATMNDMPVKEEDAMLINHVRSSVEKWQEEPIVTRENYLNIPDTSEGGVRYIAASQVLNRYQIRLVHQIVRNEYPVLKSTGKGHFVQITHSNSEQELSEKLQQARYRDWDISRAIEFRWLIEAISGGDITGMPREYFTSAFESDVKSADGKEKTLTRFVDDLQQKLNSRRRILIGHNCFMDLVYLYNCFMGQLPEKVERFQEMIRENFPAVVDTKFIASFGRGWGRTNLQDLALDLSTNGPDVPVIEIPVDFDRYAAGQMLHEAGYDSLLTAKIAVKLSAKLGKEGKFPAYQEGENLLATDDDASENYATAPQSIAESEAGNLAATVKNVLSTPMAVIGNFFSSDLASAGQQFEHVAKHENDAGTSDQLEDLMVFSDKGDGEGEGLLEVSGEGEDAGESIQTTVGSALLDLPVPSSRPLTKAEILEKVEKGELMPRWEGGRGFWQYFGQKLQVNSAEERICYL